MRDCWNERAAGSGRPDRTLPREHGAAARPARVARAFRARRLRLPARRAARRGRRRGARGGRDPSARGRRGCGTAERCDRHGTEPAHASGVRPRRVLAVGEHRSAHSRPEPRAGDQRGHPDRARRRAARPGLPVSAGRGPGPRDRDPLRLPVLRPGERQGRHRRGCRSAMCPSPTDRWSWSKARIASRT